jgi:type II secretory pathway predicted ATPase ExeA
MNKKLLALFGLKYNPFSPEVPTEALRPTPPVESFFWKIQQALLRDGGFALIVGEPGTGNYVKRSVMQRRRRNSLPANDECSDNFA